jgi:chemotaxis protein MotB
MVLFIVMFAISQVDQKKFAALRTGLAVGFGAESVAFKESGDKLQEAKDSTPFDVAAKVGEPKDTARDAELQAAVADADRARQSAMAQHAKQEVDTFEKIKKEILEALDRKGLADTVRFSIDERGLVVTIVTSSVVFQGDRADLLGAGQLILEAVGPPLLAIPNRIQVDGHTNQLPGATINYPTGWELSTARASSVVRYLIGYLGIPETRLSAAGFADTRPLYPVSDARATTMNRRVEVVVLSSLPPAERALLPSAAAGKN